MELLTLDSPTQRGFVCEVLGACARSVLLRLDSSSEEIPLRIAPPALVITLAASLINCRPENLLASLMLQLESNLVRLSEGGTRPRFSAAVPKNLLMTVAAFTGPAPIVRPKGEALIPPISPSRMIAVSFCPPHAAEGQSRGTPSMTKHR
jgi:hypothetical protein